MRVTSRSALLMAAQFFVRRLVLPAFEVVVVVVCGQVESSSDVRVMGDEHALRWNCPAAHFSTSKFG